MRQQLLPDILPEPAQTLENFVTGANEALVAALRECRPGRAIYLWGSPGAGRSHLLHAMSRDAGTRYLGPDDARALQALAQAERNGLQRLAIDDVHLLDDAGQAALFRLYNLWRSQAGSRHAFSLILAGDRAPLALPLREDLRTRLGWDLVFRVELLSDDDRARALHALAQERGLQLAPALVNWLLTYHARDMRVLQELVITLDRYSLEQHRPVTLPLLKELLLQTGRQRSRDTPATKP